MWHSFEWGWDIGAQMLLWWSILLLGLITIVGLICVLAGIEEPPVNGPAVKAVSRRAPA
jgi:hypothetical protein